MTILTSQADFSLVVKSVVQAGQTLRSVGAERQSQVLEVMASQLQAVTDDILEANTLDLEASLEMAIPEVVLDWLKLTPERLQNTLKMLRRLAALGDPRLLKLQPGGRLSPNLTSYGQVVPLGVVALIYEGLPELAVIMAGFCIRTGNGLVLKGGNEASQTHQVIMAALQRALQQSDLPVDCLLSLTEAEGEAARVWLLQDPGIDLIIPYGRPSLVQQAMRQAAVPVLPTAIGNGYLYWAASGKLATVIQMVVDSHRGEPDAVNALEKILVDRACSSSLLSQCCNGLWEHGFDLLGDEALVAEVGGLKLAKSTDWNQPFLSKTVALRRVDHLGAAASWINQHGAGHVSALASDVHHEVGQFTQRVNSAVLYINASPRFLRNPAQSANMALGMTAQRGRCYGFVGLEALLTTQHILQGLG